ncbi:MAG TPA: hypothetical protein ENN19_13735 [Chloroflexi bacterium]|nr:hypothetical protein [Chloroflexota bacterium]
MTTTIAQSILRDQGIAYVVAAPDLVIAEAMGLAEIRSFESQPIVGRWLPDVFPELVGAEEVLDDILSGALPRFDLTWINREDSAGRTIYLTMVTFPHKDQEGQIVGLIHTVQDVTKVGDIGQQLAQHRNDLRLLQSQLAEQNLKLTAANAELQRLNRIKSQFISIAAHELRTPMMAISGYLEMLLNRRFGPLSDAQRDRLEIVYNSAQRLKVITQNLLDITRIETGGIDLVLRPTDLRAIVKTVTDELIPQMEAKEQHFDVYTASDLPLVLCDETRATQIMGNLLHNAVKYTPSQGQITVFLTATEQEGFVQVSVADDGIGIPPQDQDDLFTRFFRATNAAQADSSGAGLGLCIARSLIELHGGRIWFESSPGVGSIFHVTFPVADESSTIP